MWILIRSMTYAVLFIGFVLVFLPARVLVWSGITPVPAIGVWQVVGIIAAAIGGALAFWCVLAFALLGKGTPAPFDAPRRLVVRGPYRFVRNPMYISAGCALGGAVLFYKSIALLGYLCLLGLIAHIFIVFYEEPTLRQTFGDEYEDYCARVRRWLPRM